MNSSSILTQGMTISDTSSGDFGCSLITGGYPIVPSVPTAEDPPTLYQSGTGFTTQGTSANLGAPGSPYSVSSPNGSTNYGQGYNPYSDPSTLVGANTPYISPRGLNTTYSNGMPTFAGSDIQALIEIPNQSTSGATPRLFKALVELSTLSISIYRAKSPARACGFINAKGYARGTRTIAGTMIFTKSTVDVLGAFLQDLIVNDTSKDSFYKKVDQLPPFNMTLLFANEYGYVSYQRLLGIEFLNDGSVYAAADNYSENTVSYVAADFTPLTAYTNSVMTTVFGPETGSSAQQNKTVANVWNPPPASTSDFHSQIIL